MNVNKPIARILEWVNPKHDPMMPWVTVRSYGEFSEKALEADSNWAEGPPLYLNSVTRILCELVSEGNRGRSFNHNAYTPNCLPDSSATYRLASAVDALEMGSASYLMTDELKVLELLKLLEARGFGVFELGEGK